MLDGTILGVHQAPEAFVAAMRKLRRAGHLSAFISLAVSHGTVSISADGGRICRPLIVCRKGRPRLKDEQIAKVCLPAAGQHLGRQLWCLLPLILGCNGAASMCGQSPRHDHTCLSCARSALGSLCCTAHARCRLCETCLPCSHTALLRTVDTSQQGQEGRA